MTAPLLDKEKDAVEPPIPHHRCHEREPQPQRREQGCHHKHVMFNNVRCHVPDVASLQPERKRLGRRGDPYDLQQHTAYRMRVIGGISDIPAYRCMAIPQMLDDND